MGRADRLLYSSLRRIVRRFHEGHLPMTGVAGTQLVCWNLDPAAAAADWFRRPGTTSFEEGVRLLPRLEAQHEVLRNAEEPTLEALAEWCELAGAWGARGVWRPFAAAAAAEDGMALLCRQVSQLADPLQLGTDAPGDGDEAEPPLTLDGVATAARQRHPGLFPGVSHADVGGVSGETGGGGLPLPELQTPSAQQQADRLHALADVLYAHHKLRCPPFEWVYDGMKPLLLPEVLKRRKGAAAAVAVAAAALGRRLGVPLLPLPVAPGRGVGGAAAADVPTDGLPAAVALRLSNSAQALAPGPGDWLLLLDSTAEGWLEDAAYLDAGSGKVLTRAAVAERHPGEAARPAAEWRARSPLATWQGLARLALQGHQRRGESDLVAHWMYVAMALDPGAPEWAHVLSG